MLRKLLWTGLYGALGAASTSLIKARAKGQAPANQVPGARPAAPSAPQIAARRPKKPGESGPNPFAIVGGALAAGIALAKWIDWRGHAHPRD